jgi:hypothetical protein
LLQVTDGGFYDNLGLVELFRRGCTRIYCVDASGDSPPAATTLAQALTLAHEELGVETALADNTWATATPGSGVALSPADPLAKLSARLSETGIITGDFKYPECGPSAGKHGHLVVAKASLWPQLPYPLMAYAEDNVIFPHDSTADQWFDDDQYAAYTELGRHLGQAAAAAMRAKEEGSVSTPSRRSQDRAYMPGAVDTSQERAPAEAQPVPLGGNGSQRRRGIGITIQWKH